MLTTTIASAFVRFAVIAAATALQLLSCADLFAQSFVMRAGSPASAVEMAPPSAAYAVRLGERATYDVELRGRGVGTASLAVLGEELVDGQATVHASLALKGGLLLMRVDDRFDSWFDPDRFISRRFSQHQRELRKTRRRNYEIAPEQQSCRETTTGEVSTLSTTEPLDDVSFLFYVRTLPLRVGDVDTIPRYFKSGREVIIRVLRRERVTVPAGTFETIVVQPAITNAGGLLGQAGKAEVHFTDDSARTLVMLRSHVPVLGSLALTLRDVTTR